MSKNRLGHIWLALAVTFLLAAPFSQARAARPPGKASGTTVIVVPALYRAIQIAFDVQRFQSAILVSYQRAEGTDEVIFHGWDGSNWQRVEADLYRSGGFTALPILHTIIVGDERTPQAVYAATDWAPIAHQIKSYALADQVNGYAKALNLTPQQIRWFARRYDMQIEDLNWERRRYGRYGAPGGRQHSLPPPAQFREVETEPSLGRFEARELSDGTLSAEIPEKGLAPSPVRQFVPAPVAPPEVAPPEVAPPEVAPPEVAPPPRAVPPRRVVP
ncbi:MAG: hypothetical protein O2901_10985, partial [Verrucomicrobia bacterium]|nr:hypothetical protein [Verrucomicrobiota bacterium]